MNTHELLAAMPASPCHRCSTPTITAVLSDRRAQHTTPHGTVGEHHIRFGLIDATAADEGPWSLAPPDLLGDATCAWFIAHTAGPKPGNRWNVHDCTQPTLALEAA